MLAFTRIYDIILGTRVSWMGSCLGHVQRRPLPRLGDDIFTKTILTPPRDERPVVSRGDGCVPCSKAEETPQHRCTASSLRVDGVLGSGVVSSGHAQGSSRFGRAREFCAPKSISTSIYLGVVFPKSISTSPPPTLLVFDLGAMSPPAAARKKKSSTPSALKQRQPRPQPIPSVAVASRDRRLSPWVVVAARC